MVPAMLDSEMIEDTAKIVNEAIKDKVQVNLIINNPADGAAALVISQDIEGVGGEKLAN